MIIKSDVLYQSKTMYPSKKTTITKLMGDDNFFINTITPFSMLDNFVLLYHHKRLFKIVELK